MTHISHLTATRLNTLELTPEPTFSARQDMALRDLRDAASMWRLCWQLAWLDIKIRYRGSVLGPFWLTISTAVMVGAMGGIYAELLHIDMSAYLPFLALSLVLWGFLATMVNEACICFTAVEGTIRSVRMPYSLFAGRIVVRNVLVLAHNLLAIIAVFAILRIVPGPTALLAAPAFVLWLADALAVALLFGAICARFRDIPQIVASVLQIVFFVTPVIWQPNALSADRQWVLTFNPFYAVMEIVRAPLLNSIPKASVYVSAVVFSALLWAITWMLFARVRARIAFWI